MLCVLIKDVQDLDFISAAQLMKKQDLKLNPTLRRFVIEEHNRCVSLRQSSEWGMLALQGSFTRLKTRSLTSDSPRRGSHNALTQRPY
jgi:hypothetical protein